MIFKELKPIDVSKYTVTESGNVIRTDNKETFKNALNRIAELKTQIEGKENEFKYFSNSFKKKIADLEKENAELRKRDDQLTKAKEKLNEAEELLNMVLRLHYKPDIEECTLNHKVAQFLKEIKEK